jgi:WS/DGAT/MGAT family acyltransferase
VAERTFHADRRMSDLEAMMWNVEKDPHLASTFGSITLFDRVPDLERFRYRLERAAALIPRLRQRVVPSLGRMAPPEWQDDPDFDIARHVRHVALPGGGTATDRDLFDHAARFVLDPFDRTRPLWEFEIIEGLTDGRAALVQKMHHAITDGEGGIRMSEQFIDLERDSTDPDPVAWPTREEAERGNVLEAAGDALTHSARRGLGMLRRSAEDAAHLLTHPQEVVGIVPEVVETARSAVRQLTVVDPAHSPLWNERTLQRRFDTLDVDFEDARAAAKRLGGSLNDFFVSGAAAGIGAYHRQLGAPVDELRMAMPISTRQKGTAGGNSFAPTRVLVPTGDLHPEERFAQVVERLGVTKSEKAIGLVGATAGVANLLPTSVLVRFARQQVETVDFATSNLRAAPIKLYMAGAEVFATYPMGPLSGTACNLTMMSYDGMLNMGLHTDAGAVTQPELLVALLAEAYADLIAAGA